MTILRLFLAILMPWVLGILWVRMAWPGRPPGGVAAVLGYGYLVGVLALALVMLAVDSLGLAQDFWTSLVIMGLLGGGGAWLTRTLGWYPFLPFSPGEGWYQPTWRRAAAGLLILLLVLQFFGLALEIVWRPLFPWDAWMNWAPKARVWLEQGHLVPFVAPEDWVAAADPEVYTLGAWHYPPLVPLVQLWMAMALGYWDESLINLPWWFCGVALVLACYGQARALGASRLFAVVLVYVLASMPFLGTHIALAGYADLWMAGFYALGVIAFTRWALQRDGRQGLLALVFVVALPLIKNPGLIWAATFLPAVALVLIPGKKWLLVVVGGAATLLAVYFTTGIHFNLPGIGEVLISAQRVRLPGHDGAGLEFFPVWDALWDNGFLLANWHLFWYLALPPLLVALPVAWHDRRVGALLVLAAGGLGFLFFIFFFNHQYSRWAQDYTTLNRAFLHLVPALVFIEGALLLRVLAGHGVRSREREGLTSSQPAGGETEGGPRP